MGRQISIYKDFGRPFAKVFLMAVFVYQTIYWTWLKMEKDEEKRAKNGIGIPSKCRRRVC